MRRAVVLALVVSVAAVTSLFAGDLFASDQEDWQVRRQDSVSKKFALSGGAMRVDIDNLEGYVHVTGTDAPEVDLRAQQTIRAQTGADLAQARKEVSLNFKEEPGSVSVLYDAPWRCHQGQRDCGDSHRRFYEVVYDIEVRVPRNARLVISTVNRGDITVNNVAGPFEVRNVNGAVTMEGVGGSGDATTVNGPVWVGFVKSPSDACNFKTVNGSIDAYFPRDLSADLLFKTFNGQVYADFDVAPRAAVLEQPVHEGGKFIYRGNHFAAGRVGRGGSECKFETLNGNIRLHER